MYMEDNLSDVNPVAILLVSSGSRGDRLLFKYPYEIAKLAGPEIAVKCSPYALNIENSAKQKYCQDCFTALMYNFRRVQASCLENNILVGLSDDILGNLLSVKKSLCNSPFELKINDVIFAAFPLLLQNEGRRQEAEKKLDLDNTIISFNVVFALHRNASCELIQQYQSLSQQIAVALSHEEKRCRYLNEMKDTMWQIQDEVHTLPESQSCISPYGTMLTHNCQLATHLRLIYEQLCNSGHVKVNINNWVQLDFCLPQKVYFMMTQKTGSMMNLSTVQRSLDALRPFHAVLLLFETSQLLELLPLDASPSVLRVVKIASPLKNLMTIATESDLSLSQVYHVVCQLVSWGKAMVIYPLCDTNVYVLTPGHNMELNGALSEDFAHEFKLSLPDFLSKFSLPLPLCDHGTAFRFSLDQRELAKMVVWLLERHLVTQLHTFVYLTSTAKPASSHNADLGHFRRPSVLNVLRNRRSSESDLSDEPRSTCGSQDSLLTSLPVDLQKSVMSLPAAADPQDLKLFSRLCAYFDGSRPLEEIMYYENLQRSTLHELIDKFRAVLVTTQHEDPGLSAWIT